ncbi:SGNH/GDSL hydrolase family protein [Microbacterium esteraromaticum]|uniref:SGNH/GDSL hydrolase family protein n=1 Tax=Microbacterium esteraromaticum TaxID=57043 RepID=A0A7D7WGS2_9MICO|nr:SGNH/GDSL hydrolase family protein [Microbacterium esteraromaticum]QMU96873.1 SGNH/GDSL hydrolase family protein [Microbacterium esteraromaticum]
MTTDLTRLRELLHDETPLNWVLTGDSITHGLIHTQGERNYVDHLHELIRGDLARVRDVVINTAISGWRIVQLLEDFDRRVATWRPHVVTLMVGTNDCSTGGVFPIIEPADFAASLTEFVTRVRETGAVPVLMTQPAVDVTNAPERARIADFAQALRDVADHHETILVDNFARFAELGTGRTGGIPWGLMNDPFHPNATGHAVIAAEVASVLDLRPLPTQNRVRADLANRIARV